MIIHESKKHRIYLWDNLKFFLITMVVIGHCIDMFSGESRICQSIFLFVYSFHMPLFLFISGLFHSDKNILSKCIYFFSVGMLLKILLFVMQQGTEEFQLLYESGIPWYMFVIAVYIVITYLLRNHNKKYILILNIVFACFVGYDQSIGDFLCLSKVIVFYPFYLSGALIDPERMVSFKKRHRWIYILAAAVFLLWGFLCFTRLDLFYRLRHLFTGRNPFNLELVPHGALARAFCYMISAVVSLALIILCPNKKIPVISKMGTRTLDVYFWHWPLFLVLDHFLHITELWSAGWTGKIIYLMIPMMISVVLALDDPISYPLKIIRNASYAKIKEEPI